MSFLDDPKEYAPRDYERAAFGDAWCMDETEPPKRGEERLCARYGKLVYGAGILVEVYRCALPAVFYAIKTDDFTWNMGSGQHQLAAQVAKALSEDMLGVQAEENALTSVWAPPKRSEAAVEIGQGVLDWSNSERRSDRYGAVVLCDPRPDWEEYGTLDSRRLAPFAGQLGRLYAVVTQVREADHFGDPAHGIGPIDAMVGEEVFLGEGRIFTGCAWDEVVQIGLRPEDGRNYGWLAVDGLYTCHNQIVTLYLDVMP